MCSHLLMCMLCHLLGEANCHDIKILKQPYREVLVVTNWGLIPLSATGVILGSISSSVREPLRKLQYLVCNLVGDSAKDPRNNITSQLLSLGDYEMINFCSFKL